MNSIRKSLLGLVILVLFFGLTGCKAKSKTTSKQLEKDMLNIMEEEKIAEIMKSYEKLGDKDDNLNELILFIEDNIEKLDRENGNILILDLEEELLSQLGNFKDDFVKKGYHLKLEGLKAEEGFLSENWIKKLGDDDLKETIKSLNKNYYKLISINEEMDIIIDYDRLLQFNEKISQETSDYFSIQAARNAKPAVNEGEINITYEELSNRLFKMEEYIKTYKDSERYERVLSIYRDGLIVYLSGTEKTPIYIDENNKSIKNELLKDYNRVASNKDYITSFIIREYLEILNENNKEINEKVEGSLLSLVNRAINFLED